MIIQQLLKLLSVPSEQHYYIVCPDSYGLGLMLPPTLGKFMKSGDLHQIDAETMTRDRVRELESIAHDAPKYGSPYNLFFIYRAQTLSPACTAPLLKTIEDIRGSRFIFQASTTPYHLLTIRSRCIAVVLPFLPKPLVLGNIRALQRDASAAAAFYDGTLGGTNAALNAKDHITNLRRLVKAPDGLESLLSDDSIKNPVFHTALDPVLAPELRRYLTHSDTDARRRLVTILARGLV